MNRYLNLNPRSISRMTAKEVRTAYSSLRSILRKRNERAEAKGIAPVYPTPAPVKQVPNRLLRSELADVAVALRDPVSKISGKLNQQQKAARTLASHGFRIPTDKMSDFGRFMEATRKRQGETYKGKSGVAVQAYEELVKAGVSGKTIERSFKKWLENTETLNQLVNAAQIAAESHPGKRVTGVELREIMSNIDPFR